jgi:hypothetical protein
VHTTLDRIELESREIFLCLLWHSGTHADDEADLTLRSGPAGWQADGRAGWRAGRQRLSGCGFQGSQDK